MDKQYLRRRNPDEFFHFAYSDFYFGLLHSSIDNFPVAGAVAASAAFPVLVDHATLTDYCGTKGKDNIVTLMDGGVNDNQALIEIYMILTELVLRQHRSDVLPEQPETLSPNDTAFVFIVNSSVSDSTGLSGDGVTGSPHSAIEWVSSLLQKISRSIDVYSGVNYNLRKQLYMTQLKNISADHRYARVEPKEISLTGLDQYRRGGLQAALWEKSGLPRDPTDLDDEIIHYRQSMQRDVYRQIVQDTATRQDLGLSHWHPQCYYDIRERLDASLASVGPDEQDCLRQAARWAVALKTQEICHEAQKSPDHRVPDGLNCSGGVINITHGPSILGRPRAIAGSCDMILAPIAAENAKFSRMGTNLEDSCRDLDRRIQSAIANTSQPVQ